MDRITYLREGHGFRSGASTINTGYLNKIKIKIPSASLLSSKKAGGLSYSSTLGSNLGS